MRTSCVLALSGLVVFGGVAQAQFVRQEVLVFKSITLSDTDFLNAKKETFHHGKTPSQQSLMNEFADVWTGSLAPHRRQ